MTADNSGANQTLERADNTNPIIAFVMAWDLSAVRRAVASGILIGSSFVFKKKGLLRSQAGGEAGEGVVYLKSVCTVLSRIKLSTLNCI